MRLSPGWFNHRNSGVWWNCLRSAASIIDTSGERRSHLVRFGRLTSYASRRFGRRTNRSVVPPRRSHQRTSFSRSSPKGHQAGKFHHREVLANHSRRYRLSDMAVMDSITALPTSLREFSVSYRKQDGGEGGIRTHVPAFGRQDAFEAPPL